MQLIPKTAAFANCAQRLLRGLILALMLLSVRAGAGGQSPTVLERLSNTTLKMPQTPQSFGYKTQLAFGALPFTNPVAVRTAPGETNRIFVIEQGGKVFAITNLSAPTKTLFLDLSSLGNCPVSLPLRSIPDTRPMACSSSATT